MATDFQKQKVAGVFNAMDVNGDGFLQEHAELWYGFWAGDDESSPSKWVFGPF